MREESRAEDHVLTRWIAVALDEQTREQLVDGGEGRRAVVRFHAETREQLRAQTHKVLVDFLRVGLVGEDQQRRHRCDLHPIERHVRCDEVVSAGAGIVQGWNGTVEVSHGFPELRVFGDGADVQGHHRSWSFVECAQGGIHDNSEGSSTSTSKSPEKVCVLVVVGSDEGSLSVVQYEYGFIGIKRHSSGLSLTLDVTTLYSSTLSAAIPFHGPRTE